jgi:hypothetical protein
MFSNLGGFGMFSHFDRKTRTGERGRSARIVQGNVDNDVGLGRNGGRNAKISHNIRIRR